MKIIEIIDASHVSAELEPEVVQSISQRLLLHAKRIDRLTSKIELGQLAPYFFCLFRGDEVLGWLELGDVVKIYDKSYYTVKFIYIKSTERKKPIVGAFLLALKRHLIHPLIIGSDEYGGVLFKGGLELVRALAASIRFEVGVLNTKTGELTPFNNDALKAASSLTLVFERSDFPLFKDGGAAGQFYIFEGDL